jgi:hypothetical protein
VRRRQPSEAAGWRAYIGYDIREDDAPAVFVFCTECAELEFGYG